MSRWREPLSAAGAVCKRDFLLFASYRMRFFTTFVTTAVSLSLFYYVSRLVHSSRVGSPDDYYAFVTVGIVILGVLTSTLAIPILTLRQELLAGTFERMVLSAFGPVRSILSLVLFPLLLALVNAVASVTFAALVFGLHLHWSTVAAAPPVALLGAVAFAPFGLLMAAAVVLFKQTNAGTTFVVTGITVLAGLYFPVTLLPDWIRWTSDVQPFTPAVDLLRHLLVATPLQGGVAEDLIKLVAFPLVMLPLALWAINAAVQRSQRRGTIIEY
jgi:ABC-2 type transport system permease protein